MTVAELIAELQQYDGDTPVHLSYNYGDHWRTTVAPMVKQVEELPVKHSEYHSMPKVLDEEDKEYDTADQVVVLS